MLKYGLISDIDTAKGLARVHFNDDDIVSDWLPILVPKAMEDSFSWFPDINEHVACLMDEHAENGVILGSLYNSTTAPNGGNRDKWRVRFKDGTVIEYDRAAHKLLADVQGSVEVKATGAINVDGQSTVDVKAQGAVTVDTSASATLKAISVTIDAPTVTVTGILSAGQISAAPGSAGGNGNVSIQGNVSVQGAVSVSGGDVSADGISLKSHVHGGVQPGGSTTSTPQ